MYKQISSNIVIARMENDYKIDYQDWHNRVPEWILKAIADLDIVICLTTKKACLTVVNYKATLPCHVDLIRGIEYNGGTYYQYRANDENEIDCADESIELCIHYNTIASEYDDIKKIHFPLIPDDDKLIDGLEWYCLMRMLYRGWKNPVLSLESKNAFVNPAIMWESLKKGIRNSLSVQDPHERELISIIQRTVIQKLDTYNNNYFDNLPRL